MNFQERNSRMRRGTSEKATRAILAVATIVLFLWIASDSRHYWHEARFLFVTTQFTMTETLSGSFNPHQLGSNIDERESSGFYNAKYLHLLGLHKFFSVVEPNNGGWLLATSISLIILILTGLLTGDALSRLDRSGPGRLTVFVVFAMLPVSAYLAGKLLSEVTSLLFVAVTIRALVWTMTVRGGRVLIGIIIAATCTTLTALTRLDMIICLGTFIFAYSVAGPVAAFRKRLFLVGSAALVSGSIMYLAILGLTGIDGVAIWHYFVGYLELESKSIASSLLALATFGGFVYVLAVIAVIRKWANSAFQLIWLFSTAVPLVVITSNYMIEPRYLSAAIMPMVALGSYGLSAISSHWKHPYSAMAIALVAVMAINRPIIGLMPYELDGGDLEAAVDSIENRVADPLILLPWSYSDYHWLSAMRPDLRIYNVHAPGGQVDTVTEAWTLRFRGWYGDRWLDSAADLASIQSDAESAFYIGWRYYPPAENLARGLEYLGVGSADTFLVELNLLDHRRESWLWVDRNLASTSPVVFGQYEVRLIPPLEHVDADDETHVFP